MREVGGVAMSGAGDHMVSAGDAEQAKRIRGALIGCAYGDAMGMPTEFVPRPVIKETCPRGIETFLPSLEGGVYPRSLRAGEVTDDTVNTVLVAELLIDRKGDFDARAYIDYLKDWIERNPDKNDVVSGPSTRRALDALEHGAPLAQAGVCGTTNGAAMKISPVGCVEDYRDMECLVDAVEQVCLATHNTGIAIAGASAVAACVSYGVSGGSDMDEMMGAAAEAIHKGSSRGFPYPSVDLGKRLELVCSCVEGRSLPDALALLSDVFGCGVEVSETIPAALCLVRLAEGNAVQAARLAACVGGDTDTIGAIAGAICGSMRPDVFPQADVELLETVNGLDFDALAEGLLSARLARTHGVTPRL